MRMENIEISNIYRDLNKFCKYVKGSVCEKALSVWFSFPSGRAISV